eukprot:Skav210301  [mRNA]  locus=scaffold475:144198:145342:- [translate_table: standard]
MVRGETWCPPWLCWCQGFGQSLACGDFDGDGIDDLAVGSPTRGSIDQVFERQAGAKSKPFAVTLWDAHWLQLPSASRPILEELTYSSAEARKLDPERATEQP